MMCSLRLQFFVLFGLTANILILFVLYVNLPLFARFLPARFLVSEKPREQPARPPYSQLLFLSTSNSSVGSSDPWTPLSLSNCTFGTPSYYAPCVAEHLDGVLYAEELVYPDFEIREPYFANEDHRQVRSRLCNIQRAVPHQLLSAMARNWR